MLRTGLRHLISWERVDRWLHDTDGRRRLAGLLAAPLLALLWLSGSASPAAADCTAGPSGGETVFICTAGDPVVFSISNGLLKHNRATAGDVAFADDLDFNTNGGFPGSEHLTNAATTKVEVFGNTSDNNVTIGDVNFPASAILVTFNVTHLSDGTDQVTIDDTANTAIDKQIVVTANAVTIVPGGTISYDGPSGLETLLIKAGGGRDIISVQSTSAGTATRIEAGDGNDAVLIRDSKTLDTILGPLTVAGGKGDSPSGSDQIDISDSAETTGNAYIFSNSNTNSPTLQRANAATITYLNMSTFSLTTGSGNDAVTVDELPFQQTNMTLNLGAGNDRIVWDSVTSQVDMVSIDAGTGTDTFLFNGPTAGTQVTTLNCTGQLTFGTDCNATANRIAIAGMEQVTINGSPVRDDIQVTATSGLALTVNALAGDDNLAVLGAGAGSTVAINAGDGDDIVGVAVDASIDEPTSALGIQAPVTVDGGAGTNRLTIARGNTSPAPVPPAGAATVTVTPTQVGAATGDNFFGPGGSVTYAGFQTLILQGYDVNDTIHVTPSATTDMTIVGSLQTTADTLDVNTTGTTGAILDLAANPNEIRFDNRRTVKFAGIESKQANGQPIAGLVALGASSFSVAENAGPASITVTRSSPLGAASVQLATGDGTATGGVDYTPATLTVQFASGETSKTVTIAILNDTLVEGDETVNLTLSSVVGLVGEAALGTQTTAVLHIQDDDVPGPCTSRPNIQVAARAIGGGRLEATITAPSLSGTTNGLTQIVFNSLQNSIVQIGAGTANAGATIPLGGAQTVTFIVTRQTAGQATHVAFTVHDTCGDWPSFVGGGPGAF